eukprot:4559204-Amphidinium_carterae.1
MARLDGSVRRPVLRAMERLGANCLVTGGFSIHKWVVSTPYTTLKTSKMQRRRRRRHSGRLRGKSTISIYLTRKTDSASVSQQTNNSSPQHMRGKAVGKSESQRVSLEVKGVDETTWVGGSQHSFVAQCFLGGVATVRGGACRARRGVVCACRQGGEPRRSIEREVWLRDKNAKGSSNTMAARMMK